MLIIREVYEREEMRDYLEKRGLIKQYLKAVNYLKSGIFQKLDLKERQPKGTGIYSFRINKQFRVFGYIDDEDDFIVSKINNHQ